MITTKNYSLEEGEKGFVVDFPTPSNINVNKEYILYFDAPILLPKNSSASISFEPASGSYSVQVASGFIPKIFIKIKGLKKLQIKTLLRLIVKDTKNNILHTDYILIICSPQSEVKVSGTLLVYSAGVSPLGPNAGSLIQIDATESSSAITVGSIVTGPGLLPDSTIDGLSNRVETFFVRSILSNNVIELNVAFRFIAGIPYTGIFSFLNSISCVDPNKSTDNDAFSTYTALDYNNNWTYKIRDQIIAKFIPNAIDQSLVVLLPLKNTGILAPMSSSAPIPYVSIIKIGGRVNQDSIPVSEI
jgi:hypothetical protein